MPSSPTPARATRNRAAPSGPLYCVELDRWLPLDLSVPQAAALVGVSERTAYRAARTGEWTDLCVRVTGGDLRLATAPLLKRYGLTVGARRAVAL